MYCDVNVIVTTLQHFVVTVILVFRASLSSIGFPEADREVQ